MNQTYLQWHGTSAVRSGNIVICSSVLGEHPDGTVPGDPATQFTLAFENLERILTAAGAVLAHVVELVTFHVDPERNLDCFASVKDRFIDSPLPAWTAVGVAQLGAGSTTSPLVEMRATADILHVP
ncbi:Rid family hydrolase [Prescottella equi]|uniref:Rid family hydrolase n=1 Tax=Rhodococcus hoagii TaxID=43767 RepID=UPI0015855CB0|nr:Rid family hydrolase [Prescottella equi]MBM4733861.1 RidA family protein [Prescottella equi]MBM4734611.1 RidA family protein [Prescottella equi]